jgi:hypothetical protein
MSREQAEKRRDYLNERLVIDAETRAKVKRLNEDGSGNANSEMRKAGWKQIPVVDWNGTLYAMLYGDIPHPGRNTQEVINVSEFNARGNFEVLVTRSRRTKDTEGYAWIYDAEGGFGLMTVWTDEFGYSELHEYANPRTAVLTYNIVPPTPSQVAVTNDEMMEDLENTVLWGV